MTTFHHLIFVQINVSVRQNCQELVLGVVEVYVRIKASILNLENIVDSSSKKFLAKSIEVLLVAINEELDLP
jgi:hypothetical protein